MKKVFNQTASALAAITVLKKVKRQGEALLLPCCYCACHRNPTVCLFSISLPPPAALLRDAGVRPPGAAV